MYLLYLQQKQSQVQKINIKSENYYKDGYNPITNNNTIILLLLSK